MRHEAKASSHPLQPCDPYAGPQLKRESGTLAADGLRENPTTAHSARGGSTNLLDLVGEVPDASRLFAQIGWCDLTG